MMILGAWLLGVACGVGYMMILNEWMKKRLEESRPPVPTDDDDDPDISDQDHDIQIRAW